jgi:hypothetical protein
VTDQPASRAEPNELRLRLASQARQRLEYAHFAARTAGDCYVAERSAILIERPRPQRLNQTVPYFRGNTERYRAERTLQRNATHHLSNACCGAGHPHPQVWGLSADHIYTRKGCEGSRPLFNTRWSSRLQIVVEIVSTTLFFF